MIIIDFNISSFVVAFLMRSKNRVAKNTIMLDMTLYVNNLKIEISNDMVRSNFESPGGFDTLCDQMKN